MDDVSYLQLPPGKEPPDLPACAFRAVVVVSEPVTSEWRDLVSDWLVRSGCLYMMAWGCECTLWDDSVDYAMLAAQSLCEIPDDSFIMTTWHDDEPLEEVFWYSENCAYHPTIDLTRTIIIDIASSDRSNELLRAYRTIRCEDGG
jgi:hypothetical protein